jgi:hypothetical protein
MSSAPAVPLTTEQKIDQAALEASQIVAAFSPQASALIQAGVSVEPIISGLIGMFKELFAAKAKVAVGITPTPAAAPVAVKPAA